MSRRPKRNRPGGGGFGNAGAFAGQVQSITGLTLQETTVALAQAVRQGELIAVVFADEDEPRYMPANRLEAVMANPRTRMLVGSGPVTATARARIDAQRPQVLH